jgi:hypothetical protein
VFNLFDRENNDIQYAQDYAIAGTPGFGRTFHPAVPRQARLTVNLQF